MGMMYGNGSFKGGIDAAVLAYIGNSTLTTSADNLGDAINEHEEDISEIKSNLNELDDWDDISFTGTYSGHLVGKYNSKIKIAIILYNSQTATSNYALTMNVTPTVGMYGALRNGGYLEVGTDGRLSIINSSQYSVGQVVFIIN